MYNWSLDSYICLWLVALACCRQLDVEEGEARFLENDADADGKLGWEEYLEKVYGMSEGEIDEMERSEETEAFLDVSCQSFITWV